MFVGPSGEGLRVRNQAARELKLQPFLGTGLRKVVAHRVGRGAPNSP